MTTPLAGLARVTAAALVVVASLAAGRPASAQAVAADSHTPTRLEPSAELLAETLVDRLVLSVGGDDLGELVWTRGPGEHEGAPAYVDQLHMTLDFGDDGELVFDSRGVYAWDPPHAYVAGRDETRSGDDVQLTVLEAGPEGLTAVIREGDDLRTLELPAVDHTWADVLTPTIWLRGGPEVGDEIGYRALDTDTLQMVVDGVLLQELREEDGGTVAVCGMRESGNVMGPVHFDEQGHIVGGMMALFAVRPAGTDAPATTGTLDGLVADAVAWRLDRPLGDPTEVVRLVIETDDPRAKDLPDGPRQLVEHDDDRGLVWITVDEDEGEEEEVTAQDVADALRETVRYPIRDAQVLALAREAVGSATDEEPLFQAYMLTSFVSEYLEDDLTANPLTVKDILEERRGDCSEHALLFVTLARALGIPAREVNGVVYGDDPPRLVPHAWAEIVYEDWWFQVDPTWDETTLNATHVRIGHDGDSSGLSTLGGELSFTVREVERLVVEDYWDD